MTPGSAGPAGYADWQRIVNWDAPLLFDDRKQVHPGYSEFGPFSVSRYAHLLGTLGVRTNPIRFTASWLQASNEVSPIAETFLDLDPGVGLNGSVHLPILGPFVKFRFQANGEATPFENRSALFPSNRLNPLLLVPNTGTIVGGTTSFSGAEAREFVANGYFQGPMLVFLEAGASTVICQLRLRTFTGEREVLDTIAVAANTTSRAFMIAPLGAWDLHFASAGAGTLHFASTPCMTGAS